MGLLAVTHRRPLLGNLATTASLFEQHDYDHLTYLGLVTGGRKASCSGNLCPVPVGGPAQALQVLDTIVIIDGRIAAVCGPLIDGT